MVIRIGGLASGIDTEQMVRDLMRVERMRVDKYFRQEEALKWQRDALTTTNKTLADFIIKARNDFGITRTTGTGTILRSSVQNFDWVKEAGSSDENIIKATATAAALEGTYIIKAEQLADVASVTSWDLKKEGIVDDNLRFELPSNDSSFMITTAEGSKKIELKNAEVVGGEITDFDFSVREDGDGNIISDNSLTFRINGNKIVLDKDFGQDLGEDEIAIDKLAKHIQDELRGTGITVTSDGNRLVFSSKKDIVIESSDTDSDGKLKLETMLGLKNGLTRVSNSVNDVVKQINNADIGLRAAYDANLGRLMITTKNQGAEQFISIRSISDNPGGGGADLVSALTGFTGEEDSAAHVYYEIPFGEENVEIKINGENVIIPENVKDIDDLIKYINNEFEDEYTAYKSGNGMIIRNIGGADGEGLKIFIGESEIAGEEVHGVGGKDAQIKFNGDTVKQSSNNFTMFGVNYQLQSADKDKEVIIRVKTDVDGMFDKIKEFVDNYNELIDELNGLLREENYRDFRPLTREEKEAMTEKEIELWEEKAKSGLLRNDETITRTLQSMRDGLYGSVHDGWKYGDDRNKNTLDGFYHITQIGITTGNYQSGGRLEINEEKLRNAIIDNPDGVINLLFKTSDVDVSSKNAEQAKREADEKRANSGLIERLFDDMIIGMKDIVRRAGAGEDANTLRNVQSFMLIDFVTSGSISVMDRSIMDIGKRIAAEEMNLIRREERYWSQFTAMEKALEKMNQQSTWLMAQLGQMGN